MPSPNGNSTREQWRSRFGRADPKIVCLGLNYRRHAEEQSVELPKAPLLFGKFANTLCGDGDAILLPPGIGHVDAEAELAVVIGRRAHAVPEADALAYVAGYTCANDVSARDAQHRDGQVLQDARTSMLIFSVPQLVAYISGVLTLEPGDLILTGTPGGVGVFREPKVALQDGDVVEIELEGVGVLRNDVRTAR